MSDPLLYRLGGRGTGKTTRLVKATPDGGVYLVHSDRMKGVIKGYLEQIGRKGEITVLCIEDVARDALRGRRCPVAIDHCCFEEGYGTVPEIYDAVTRMPVILTNDYEGDVITSYKQMG
jgi:hypothetical protein